MKADRKLKIIILANGNFPIGMASTNRLVSYCKGIVELGHQLKVIVLSPHEIEGEPIVNSEVSGTYQGIEFEYASGTTIWPKNNFKKIKLLIKGLVHALSIAYKYGQKNKIDALFFGSGSTRFRYVLPFYFLSRILGTKLIREKSEYPMFELKKEKFSKLYRLMAKRYLFTFFDGMLLMTHPLMDYFKAVTNNKAKLEIIPMTVEPERFANAPEKVNETSGYIAYCGYLWGNKDGVEYLIEAFHQIANKHKEVKLYLIGDTSDEIQFNRFKKKISDLKLTHKIVFTGKVDRNDMPKYLCNASVLALSRPTSLQAKGGFPTKLGEYLATGNPVVITKVGDIPLYLEDNKTAFLAEPGSSGSFAEKLDLALSNPENAKRVGLEGKKLAYGVFNYQTQSKRIVKFIRNL